jgi:hypothetical protein
MLWRLCELFVREARTKKGIRERSYQEVLFAMVILPGALVSKRPRQGYKVSGKSPFPGSTLTAGINWGTFSARTAMRSVIRRPKEIIGDSKRW